MPWSSVMLSAAKTITASFGEDAVVNDETECHVIIDVIPQQSGNVYDQIVEDRPVAIFLRSEIPAAGFNLADEHVGNLRVVMPGETYTITGTCDEKTDQHYRAYWIEKVIA